MSEINRFNKCYQNTYNCDLNEVNTTNVAKIPENPETVGKVQRLFFEMINSTHRFNQSHNRKMFTTMTDHLNLLQKKGVLPIDLYPVKLWIDLKNSLPETNQEILKHPLLQELNHLSNQEELNQSVAKDLLQFQENVLHETLKRATTPEECQALQPVVELCRIISNNVKGFSEANELENMTNRSENLFAYKFVTTSRNYQDIISYGSKNTGSYPIETIHQKLMECQDGIENVVHGPSMSDAEKLVCYNALFRIRQDTNASSKEYGMINTLIENLNLPGEINENCSFISESAQLNEESISEQSISMAHRLAKFERNYLIPLLEKVTNQKELLDLNPIIDRCRIIEKQISDSDKSEALKSCHREVIQLQKTGNLHSFLINYNKGDLGTFNRTEKRECLAIRIKDFINNDVISNHRISPEQKQLFQRKISLIQEEFNQYGNEQLLQPAEEEILLRRSRVSASPERQPNVSCFQQIRNIFRRRRR